MSNSEYLKKQLRSIKRLLSRLKAIEVKPISKNQKNLEKLWCLDNDMNDLGVYYQTLQLWDIGDEVNLDELYTSVNRLYTYEQVEKGKRKILDILYKLTTPEQVEYLKVELQTQKKERICRIQELRKDYQESYEMDSAFTVTIINDSTDLEELRSLFPGIYMRDRGLESLRFGMLEAATVLIDWINDQLSPKLEESEDGNRASQRISIHTDIIDELSEYLSEYFNVSSGDLKKILSGKSVRNQKPLFNTHKNKLGYLFAILKDNRHITNYKTEISHWICESFTHKSGPFKFYYMQRALSRYEDPIEIKSFMKSIPENFMKKRIK